MFYFLLIIDHSPFHSVLKLFTGLATAAFIAWKLIVTKAIIIAAIPANTNIHHARLVRYAKSFNHLFIKIHATGEAIMNATSTSFKKSIDKRLMMSGTLAPKTFRTPISLVRCMVL